MDKEEILIRKEQSQMFKAVDVAIEIDRNELGDDSVERGLWMYEQLIFDITNLDVEATEIKDRLDFIRKQLARYKILPQIPTIDATSQEKPLSVRAQCEAYLRRWIQCSGNLTITFGEKPIKILEVTKDRVVLDDTHFPQMQRSSNGKHYQIKHIRFLENIKRRWITEVDEPELS